MASSSQEYHAALGRMLLEGLDELKKSSDTGSILCTRGLGGCDGDGIVVGLQYHLLLAQTRVGPLNAPGDVLGGNFLPLHITLDRDPCIRIGRQTGQQVVGSLFGNQETRDVHWH